MSEFLCEIGVNFYQQGRYNEALHEFNKALIVEPGYSPALKYIQIIKQTQGVVPVVSAKASAGKVLMRKIPSATAPRVEKKGAESAIVKPHSSVFTGTSQDLEDLDQIQREMIDTAATPAAFDETVQAGSSLAGATASLGGKKKETGPFLLLLDQKFKLMPQPFEIPQENSVLIVGRNISRFLSTSPDILQIQRNSADELLVTGKNIGYTVLHIWDANGRWTSEWITTFPVVEATSYEELLLKEGERSRNFKLRYSIDWNSFEQGRRVYDWRRNYYSWSHSLGLLGQTPYGEFYSTVDVRTLATTTDLTYATIALTEGQLGNFKGFALRGLDTSPNFTNMAFPGATVRGGSFESPAFNNKLHYILFWGKEGGGRYGNLSPGLGKARNSYLEGGSVNIMPARNQSYRFAALHGWGRDREAFLHSYGYDALGTWYNDRWNAEYEAATDTQHLAYRAKIGTKQPKYGLGVELRDVNKGFNSITNTGWMQGDIGAILNANFQPTDKLNMYASIDTYKSRLYPALDKPQRLNEDILWNAQYQIDPTTALLFNYNLQNDLGKLSQLRYQSGGWGINKKYNFLKGTWAHFNYDHLENKNYSSPASDYINDRVFTGLRFNLIGEFYYYINKEFYWTVQRATGGFTTPSALDTGVDWSDHFGKLPLSGTFRLSYRDEENTLGDLSFISGQDYLEGYAELTYHPAPDKELYGSARVRNLWADNPNAIKNVEGSFNAGMRYIWDTGVRWEAMADIEGYVFKDYNSDGLRQRDEPPVAGAKIWLGKDKFETSDEFGFYKFRKVSGRKTFVNFDLHSLPSGYVLTVPISQEVSLATPSSLRVNFGIASHTEIRGFVFEDSNEDGEYNGSDKGLPGVMVLLENGAKVATSTEGRFSFVNVAQGKHKITIDLNTVPIYYLPKTAISRQLTLSDGEEYVYYVPLARVKE